MSSEFVNIYKAFPEGYRAVSELERVVAASPLDHATFELVKLRASQLNGCAYCIDMHHKDARAAGETEERLYMLAAWREATVYTESERAALALTEAVTRLADRPDPVPDEIWDEAARHYDERQLGALVLSIASINVWNRLNAATRQVTGEWIDQLIHVEPDRQAA